MNKTELEILIEREFSLVIGQTKAKEILRLSILRAFEKNASDESHLASIGNFLLIGMTGQGKTHLAKAIERIFESCNVSSLFTCPPEFRDKSGAGFQEIQAFFNLQAPKLGIIDECHDLRKGSGATVQIDKVRNHLMTALDTQRNAGQQIVFDDDNAFCHNLLTASLILMTDQPAKLPPAFRGRLHVIELEPYSVSELTEICQLMLRARGIQADDRTIARIAKCGRGNARPCERIVEHLEKIASSQGKRTVNKSDVFSAMVHLGLYPFGVRSWVLELMEMAAERPVSDTVIRARFPQLETKTIREEKAVILSLSMSHEGKTLPYAEQGRDGFRTAPAGRKFLRDLQTEGFKWGKAE